MNKKNAKRILLREIDQALPRWWTEIYQNAMSILKHSHFLSFKHAERFLKTALSYIPEEMKENGELKHVLVKCFEKGEKNGLIYMTVDVYFKFKQKKNAFGSYPKAFISLRRSL